MPPGGNRFDHRMVPDNLRVEPVPESGCWVWIGKIDRRGYGRIFRDGKEGFAHRFSWRQHRGEIPDGMGVLHRCNVPACINPDHLFLGTPADRAGHIASGWNVGEKCPTAKLTNEQAREIYAAEGTQAQIGARYGVARTTVGLIKQGKRWHLVTGAK